MPDLTDRIEHPEQILFCSACEQETAPVFSESGQHIRADCGNCGRYIKFVKQNLPPEDRAYWDAVEKDRG